MSRYVDQWSRFSPNSTVRNPNTKYAGTRPFDKVLHDKSKSGSRWPYSLIANEVVIGTLLDLCVSSFEPSRGREGSAQAWWFRPFRQNYAEIINHKLASKAQTLPRNCPIGTWNTLGMPDRGVEHGQNARSGRRTSSTPIMCRLLSPEHKKPTQWTASNSADAWQLHMHETYGLHCSEMERGCRYR